MRAFNVVAPVIASCLWLAACGARSGVQCFSDVCVGDDGVGLDDPLGRGGSSAGTLAPGESSAGPLGRGGSSAVTPPTRPGGTTDRPGETPEENEWMRASPEVDPDSAPYCAQSTTVQGPITITRREELRRLEGCSRVEGDLTVSGLMPRNLAPLRSLTDVSGTLTLSISGTLTGLESLTRVGHLTLTDLDVPTLEPLASLTFLTGSGDEADGRLTIQQSHRLTNLAGLSSLRALGDIEISGNANLESLSGLRVPSRLETILVSGNPRLSDLIGLANLGSFGRLDLRDNDSLSHLQGLEGVSSASSLHISNSLALRNTSALSQLEGLGSLTIDGAGLTNLDGFVTLRNVRDVVLRGNPNLTQVDALARLELLEDLVVTENPSLLQLPAFGELTVMDRVLVRGNAALASGPSFLRLIEARTLTISENPRLTRVDGFPELRTGGTVEVSENQDLLEVTLSALADVNRLRVLCNPNLPEASLAPLLSLGDVDVRGNLGSPSGCESGEPL